MNTAQRIQSLGIDSVMLPDCGEQVEFHAIKTADAAKMGCLPLVADRVVIDDLPPEEQKERVKDVVKTAKKVCCLCAMSPRFVAGTPRPLRNECSIESLTEQDLMTLYFAIMALTDLRLEKANQETPAATQSHSLLVYTAWFWHLRIEDVKRMDNETFAEYFDAIGTIEDILEEKHGRHRNR